MMKWKLTCYVCVLLLAFFAPVSAADITIGNMQIIASNLAHGSLLITALYQYGVLTSVAVHGGHEGSGTVAVQPESDFGTIADTDMVKAFVWDMDNLAPQSRAVSVSGEAFKKELEGNAVSITINGQTFRAILEDSAAAKTFKEKLPMELSMQELNGNEKYYYFSEPFPTNSMRPGTIYEGDLMLYGASCLVLFYDTFPSNYSYTKIGHIENTVGLKNALGSGSITVKYE